MEVMETINNYWIIWWLFILIIWASVWKWLPALFEYHKEVIKQMQSDHKEEINSQQNLFKETLEKIINHLEWRLDNIENKIDNITKEK